jgi:hypothetical protein
MIVAGGRIHKELVGLCDERVRVVAKHPPLGECEARVAAIGAKAVHHDVIVALEPGQGRGGDQDAAAPTVVVEDDVVEKDDRQT